MKECPKCKTSYTDESLRFCLTDGAELSAVPEPEKTVAFERKPVRVDFGADNPPLSFPTAVSPTFAVPPPARKGNWAIIGILVVLLVVVILGFAGFAAYIYFKPQDAKPVAETTPSPQLSPASSRDESAELKEKLADLEKKLEDQIATPSPVTFPTQKSDVRIARANSPGDGFLALRSEPSTVAGERLAKIPHGEFITVFECPKPTNPGKIKGRWCRVDYNGLRGWAFDAYMTFEP